MNLSKKHPFRSIEGGRSEKREQIKNYGSELSETLMTARVNVDKKEELKNLSWLQGIVNSWGTVFDELEKKDISGLRNIADENIKEHSSLTSNTISDQQIKYLIQLNMINAMRISRGLEHIQAYFQQKSDTHQQKIFSDNFSSYRKIQAEHLIFDLDSLISEIKNIQAILAGDTNEFNKQEAQYIKELIDLFNGKIHRLDHWGAHYSMIHGNIMDIKDILSSFPYKKIKQQQKLYDENHVSGFKTLDACSDVYRLKGTHTPDGKIKFSGFINKI